MVQGLHNDTLEQEHFEPQNVSLVASLVVICIEVQNLAVWAFAGL